MLIYRFAFVLTSMRLAKTTEEKKNSNANNQFAIKNIREEFEGKTPAK